MPSPVHCLAPRPWWPEPCQTRLAQIAASLPAATAETASRIEGLIARNAETHDARCFNLNPAANVMNPRAEAALARGLGARPSLGWPGDKYETGLEAIEEIEVIAGALAAGIFNARHAEVRVPSGAMANLFGFMALARPGDHIIAPPASIGGHVTHQRAGCAGLYGLECHAAPVNADGFTLDLDALEVMARKLKPRLITLGGSLNLFAHPVREVRAIADTVGAHLLFDAAHQCGLFAGGAWPNPLDEGAHLMTMSTYKSLGGPAGGLIVTNDDAIAERLDAVAFPGMTANFDMGRVAALALGLLDWQEHGPAYAQAMIDLARALAEALQAGGAPVFATARGITSSHQFALDARAHGGGAAMARHLAAAGFLASGIGLPLPELPGAMNGLRLGTPEITRRGVSPDDAPELADLMIRALKSTDPQALAPETAALRARFQGLRYLRR